MALYSVWDWDRNAWAIYRTRTPVSVGDDPLPHRGRDTSLGADPDTGVKPLPLGAKLIGHDHVARGEVRRRGGALGAGDDAGRGGATSSGGWLMFGLGALAASAWWWRRGRK
jgi:hypothetical protein